MRGASNTITRQCRIRHLTCRRSRQMPNYIDTGQSEHILDEPHRPPLASSRRTSIQLLAAEDRHHHAPNRGIKLQRTHKLDHPSYRIRTWERQRDTKLWNKPASSTRSSSIPGTRRPMDQLPLKRALLASMERSILVVCLTQGLAALERLLLFSRCIRTVIRLP